MVTSPKPPIDPVDPRVMSGEAWDALCDTLRRAGRLVVGDGEPSSPSDRAEGLRYLTRFLASGIAVCVEHADPDHPEFCRSIDYDRKWGLDCPDCLYLYATVRGDATYRISGNRGSANHIDIEVLWGHFADGSVDSWGTISSLNGLDLEVGPDGSFEVILSSDEHRGNWLRLEPNAEFVFVRQYFNDWDNERPADLAIERVDARQPAPRVRSDQIAARLARLCTWLERGGAFWAQMSEATLSADPNTVNVYLRPYSDDRAGMRGQAYGLGHFRCAADEAVIVELAPLRCHQWSVSLANRYWETFDFATRQTSLNGHQATLDRDGVFRAVIAHQDPGAPNWLDTVGHMEGTIALRFLLADSAPEPRLRSVPLDALRSELPADTRWVDPATRAQILDRRHHALLRRYRR